MRPSRQFRISLSLLVYLKNLCVGGLRNFGKLVVSCLHPFILCDASNIFGHIYHKSRGMTKMFLTKQNIPDLTEPDPRNHLIISP